MIANLINEEIGIDKQNDSAIRAAVTNGKITSKIERKQLFESLIGQLKNKDIVETYIPIYSPDNGLLGIFELYTDVTDYVEISKRESTGVESETTVA